VLADEVVGNKRLRSAWGRGYGMAGVKEGGVAYLTILDWGGYFKRLLHGEDLSRG